MTNTNIKKLPSKHKLNLCFVDPPVNLIHTHYFPWFIIPSPGIVQLMGYLEAHASYLNLGYFDGNTYSPLEKDIYARLADEMNNFTADIVCVSAITCAIYPAMYICHLAKQINPQCITVIGGYHVTEESELTLRTCSDIDFAVIGEGEQTLLELIEELRTSNPSLDTVRGIAFLDGDRYVQTEPRPLICELDDLPFGAYHLLPMHKFSCMIARENWKHLKGISVAFSRGCTQRCEFCSNNYLWNYTYRVRSGSKVAEEIHLLYQNYGKQNFFFCDQDFLLDPVRTDSFIEEMNKRKPIEIAIWMEGSVRSVTANQQHLKALRKLGVRFILLGVESADDQRLADYHKNVNQDIVKQCNNFLTEADIALHPAVMIDPQRDNQQSVNNLIKYMTSELKGRLVTVQILTPLPGSAYYRNLKQTGQISEFDFSLYDTFTAVMPTDPETRRQIQNFRVEVEVMSALTWDRFKRLFKKDPRDRDVLKFEMGIFYKQGILKLRDVMYGKLPYYHFKQEMIARQLNVMQQTPSWKEVIKQQLPDWLNVNQEIDEKLKEFKPVFQSAVSSSRRDYNPR